MEEAWMKKTVIIECGHGGMIDGVYQDLAAKRSIPDPKEYTFTPKGLTVYEGVLNRAIGSMLINRLIENNISYKALNVFDQNDMPLLNRVKMINEIYRHDKSAWLLSLHSNKMKAEKSGPGNKGRGCESIISLPPSVKSKNYQTIITENYKEHGHKWRGEFQRGDLYILKNSMCPAVLVENYFYDNPDDIVILLSESGKKSIVDALFDSIIEINRL